MSQPTNPQMQSIRDHAAMKELYRSLFINVGCSYLVYRFSLPRFAAGSLYPLLFSSLPPCFWLIYGLVRRGAIDLISFFAIGDIVVSVLSTMLAHNESSALAGRSLQSAILGFLFLFSLAIDKPMLRYLARQLLTGNKAEELRHFDSTAAQPPIRSMYRTLTLLWAIGMFSMTGGNLLLARHVDSQHYLLLSPVWTYGLYVLLVWGSVRYRRQLLGSLAEKEARRSIHPAPSEQTGKQRRTQ